MPQKSGKVLNRVRTKKEIGICDDMTVDELLKEADELFVRKDFRRLKWVCADILRKDPDNESALTYQATYSKDTVKKTVKVKK